MQDKQSPVQIRPAYDLKSILNENPHIILFDGVCRLCSGWVQFVVRRDPVARFRFVSVQSDLGRELLVWCGLSADDITTMVYIKNAQPVFKLDAFLNIVRQFGFPWTLLRVTYLLPAVLRDGLYDRVAVNRYRWFGRRDRCLMPTPELVQRFL